MTQAVRALVVISIAAAFFAVCAGSIFAGYTSAYTGFHSAPGIVPEQARAVVDSGSPAYAAGVRSGDTLACMPFEDSDLLYPSFQLPHYRPTPVHACIVRNGRHVRSVTIAVLPGPPAVTLYGTTLFAAIRLLAYFVFLLVGCTLVLARPNLTTWLLFAACLCSAPTAAAYDGFTYLPTSAYALLEFLLAEVIALGSPALLLFALVVPDAHLAHGWRRIAFWAVVGATVAIAVYRLISVFQDGTVVDALSDAFLFSVLRFSTYAVIIVTFVRLLTMRRDERARFGWVAFGIIVGVISNDLRSQIGGAQDIGRILSTAAGVATIIMPLSLMYAILRRHVIDIRFVISRTVVYGAITTFAIGIIAAVDWATTEYLAQMRAALAIEALVAVAIGVVLHRTYGPIENFVDFLIYRRKHESELYLRRLAKTLLRADKEETIDAAIVQAPFKRLQLTLAALFRAQGRTFVLSAAAGLDGASRLLYDKDHELVRFLSTESTKLTIREIGTHLAEEFEAGRDPAIAVPIFHGDELTGFTVYGIHQDGTKLDPDEIETLEHLCELAAQAYVRIELLRYRAISPVAVPS